MNEKELLTGAKEIMDRFNMTKPVFYMFLKIGMPVRKINGRLYGHIDNINEFLRKITRTNQPLEIDSTITESMIENEFDGL